VLKIKKKNSGAIWLKPKLLSFLSLLLRALSFTYYNYITTPYSKMPTACTDLLGLLGHEEGSTTLRLNIGNSSYFFKKDIIRHFTLRTIRATAIRAAMEVIPIWHEWWFLCISSMYVSVNSNIKIILIIPPPKSFHKRLKVVFCYLVIELAEKSTGA
jgi:hypothetical protein